MAGFTVLVLCLLPLFASARDVWFEQPRVQYLGDIEDEPLSRFVAVDKDNKIAYVTDGENLHVFGLGYNQELIPLLTQNINGTKLGAIQYCGGFISFALHPVDNPKDGELVIWEAYEPSTQGGLSFVNFIPLGAFPGRHVHTADCNTIIIPVQNPPVEQPDGTVLDDEGVVKVAEFRRGLFLGYRETTIKFRGYAQIQLILEVNGGIFEPGVGFAKGLEPNDVALNGDESLAYVIFGANNLVATIEMGRRPIAIDLTSFGLTTVSELGGWDVNSKDGIKFAKYPMIQAAYSPNSIKCMTIQGVDYIYVASGGIMLYGNKIRLADADLDPATFPDTSFQSLNLAGQLRIWAGADYDGDGDLDKVIVPGTRSVAIFNMNTSYPVLVADSYNIIDRNMASTRPDVFMSDAKIPDRTLEQSFDVQAKIRGSEPTTLSLLPACDGRWLVVVAGFTKPGGLVAYATNLEDPESQYLLMIDSEVFVNTADTRATWTQLYRTGAASLLNPTDITIVTSDDGYPMILATTSIGGTVESIKLTLVC